MNHTPDPHSRPIADSLDRIATHMPDHVEGLAANAIREAGSIRRRRTGVRAAGMAAAVAIVVPLTWQVANGPKGTIPGHDGQTGTVAASQTQSATQPTSLTTTPVSPPTSQPSASAPSPSTGAQWPGNTKATKVVDLKGAEATGSAHGAIWAEGNKLFRDGRPVTLPVTGRWDYVPLADGRGLVHQYGDPGDATVRLVDSTGKVLRTISTPPASHLVRLVADQAGRRAVIYTHNGADESASDASITLIDLDGQVVQSKTNLLHGLVPVGFVGDRFFIGNHSVKRTFAWNLTTNIVDRYTDTGTVTAVHEGTSMAALITITDEHGYRGCLDVIDVSGPTPAAVGRTCGTLSATAFSPDGRYVLGTDVYGDGLAPTETRVLDTTTGEIVLRLDGAFLFESEFLVDSSIALRLFVPGEVGSRTTIVRCTLSGACSQIVAPIPTKDELNAHYRLFGGE